MKIDVIDFDFPNGRGKLAAPSNDHLFNELKKGKVVDDFLLPVFEKYVKKDSVVVDVGANFGVFSVWLSQMAKRVYSYEIQWLMYENLKTNLFLNQCKNVLAFDEGLFSKKTCMNFSKKLDGWVGTSDPSNADLVKSFGSISFETCEGDTEFITSTLNDEFLAYMNVKIDFIKIDAEGCDVDIILGGENVIKRDHPVIAFEFNESLVACHGRSFKDIENIAAKYKYNIKQLSGGNYLLE